MTVILTSCRRCGQEFEPGREAIVAGTWRLCPDCRAAGDLSGAVFRNREARRDPTIGIDGRPKVLWSEADQYPGDTGVAPLRACKVDATE